MDDANSITLHQFLVRVGEYGGYMRIETDDLLAAHELTSTFPVFAFWVEPVVEISDAVGAELEAIAWRDSLGAD